MRMIFLAIAIFLLAGFTLGISKFGLLERVPQVLAGHNEELTFEAAPKIDEGTSQLGLARARPEGVLLLTNMNRAQTARFQMPQDAAIISGSLQLRATAQIAEGQHGVLRVLVGNQIRGDVLLRPGQYEVRTQIELTADDLASNTLGVRYQLLIADEGGTCSLNAGLPTVVEIEHDSRVLLNVMGGDHSTRDQIAAWGGVVLIGWPEWLSEEERQSRWLSAARLGAYGYDVRFIDASNRETLTGPDLEAFAASPTQGFDNDEATFEWPEYVARTGINAGSRTFKGSTTWRHWYRVGDQGHLSAPAAFNYEVTLGPLPKDAKWTIVVTHNGSILEVSQVAGNAGLHTGSLALNDVEMLDSNLIQISATSNYEAVGECNNGPDLFAELRANSRLLEGGEQIDNGLVAAAEKLNHAQPITVGFPEQMSLVEAQRMFDLAVALITPEMELRLVSGPAVLTAVRRNDVTEVMQNLLSTAMIVGIDGNKRMHVTHPAAFTGDQSEIAGGAIVLVISHPVEDRLSMAPRQ